MQSSEPTDLNWIMVPGLWSQTLSSVHTSVPFGRMFWFAYFLVDDFVLVMASDSTTDSHATAHTTLFTSGHIPISG